MRISKSLCANHPILNKHTHKTHMVNSSNIPTSVGISPDILFSLKVNCSNCTKLPISDDNGPTKRFSSKNNVLSEVIS